MSMYDVLKQPIEVRKVKYGSTSVRKIVIDGNTFGNYKAFSSHWEKTYVESPERSEGGVVSNLNSHSTFNTFVVKCDFAMMSIDDYRRLYSLMLDRNEFTVTAYNVLTNKPYTCKMYFAPDQMPKLYMLARSLQGESYTEILGVQDYTIELISTNSSMDTVEIRYYDENDVLIPEATVTVYKGVEQIVNYNYTASDGYRFDGEWQREDGNIVRNGEVIKPMTNIKLKAIVVSTSLYKLSMDYGIGIVPTPQSTSDDLNSFDIYYGQEVGSAITQAGVELASGETFTFPTQGTGLDKIKYNNYEYDGSSAYTFSGWYWTTKANSETKVESTTAYVYLFNRTIHQIYEPRTYSVQYNTNEPTIAISSTTKKYGEEVVLPELSVSGKTFKGWYWVDPNDSKEYKFVSGSSMSPFDLELYAKWE